MNSRVEIKRRAKDVFLANYWPTVGITVLAVVIFYGAGFLFFGIGSFFAMPVMIGLVYHLVQLYHGTNPPFETAITKGFGQNYLRKVGGMLWKNLWIFLWSLLFFIPGFVKALSYAMTPYILAYCPDVKATDAIKISMSIMDGHKAELFVLYLSFIGWYLLSGLTFGLLGIFFVVPYSITSFSGYFDELFTHALATGVISKDDLDGRPV